MRLMKDAIQKYHFISIFTLLLVLLLFYFPVLFLGRTLQGPEMLRMNNMLKSPPQPEDIRKGVIKPQIFNVEQYTASTRFAIDEFIGKSYKNNELPLWDNHNCTGVPIAAQYENSVFFPLKIIQSFFSSSSKDFFYVF